ncbi:hypothetical protein SAMN03159338_1606 [Sphingomonas sp. NFR04]|uniref:hypothetical protein n=1 Tax=Sphingomonas sp. NFR04 TaxID=1566283 RepID=UPI0008E7B7C1|nr:hypothetical protein [Sphingomonas sp. NFR04]SFJ50850.1 hypothetical protein SAMN03159338_1606 [Sphingomonas sp. NFR04]
MKVRITSAGWENFTGNFGFKAQFQNGVSVEDLDARQINRIASSVKVVDAETGEQIGPAMLALRMHHSPITVVEQAKTLDIVKRTDEIDRAALIEAEAARKAEEKVALEAAQAKATELDADFVIYTRAELEAIGGNDGIKGLREIGKPLGVNGRGIRELVEEILKAQAAQAVL